MLPKGKITAIVYSKRLQVVSFARMGPFWIQELRPDRLSLGMHFGILQRVPTSKIVRRLNFNSCLPSSDCHRKISTNLNGSHTKCRFQTKYRYLCSNGKYLIHDHAMLGLITVFDAILTGRQTGLIYQCLYGNQMSNNFHNISLLKNSWIGNFWP